MSQNNASTIEYSIQPHTPEAHLYEVELRIREPAAEGQLLSMPAWIPGSYMIRDFARNLVSLVVLDDSDTEVDVTKLDKQTWRCAPTAGLLRVQYQVYAWELSVRAAHLDTTHGYFNGTSVFLCAHGFQDSPCEVEIVRPEGERYRDWRVATSLPKAGAKRFGFGRYRAADYAELIDHPVEMGLFGLSSFTVAGVTHDLAITGRHQTDMERLCRDLAPICEQHIALFGELPLDRYLFMVLAVGEGYGGLEHRASTSLICKRDDLPQPGMEKVTAGYRQFLGLCSHEYFHLWNVKRIRPRPFMEAGLNAEVYTRQLWVFEGITSYYDDLALVRAGRIDPESYLELLARNITRLLRGGGRLKQSLSDSSFDAWTKFYKQDENAPNAIVSYYTKGALVALALDLTIRLADEGAQSLDNVMRALWQHYGKSGKGVPEGAVEQLVAQVTGLDLTEFFDLALRGTGDLPLKELLGEFGVVMTLRSATDAKDQGGLAKHGDETPVSSPRPVLGARCAEPAREARLSHVFDGSAAQREGLAAGDVVIAVDGIRVQSDNLDALIARVPPGASVMVHAFRRDELMTFQIKPLPAPADTCDLSLRGSAPPAVLARRRGWLQV